MTYSALLETIAQRSSKGEAAAAGHRAFVGDGADARRAGPGDKSTQRGGGKELLQALSSLAPFALAAEAEPALATLALRSFAHAGDVEQASVFLNCFFFNMKRQERGRKREGRRLVGATNDKC